MTHFFKKNKNLYKIFLLILIFSGFISTKTKVVSAEGDCKVKMADIVPSGLQTAGWYKASLTSPKDYLVHFRIQTENCQGKKIEVSIIQNFVPINEYKNIKVLIPSNNLVELIFTPGLSMCASHLGLADCEYHIEVYKTPDGVVEDYSSKGVLNGVLKYNCESYTNCSNDPWHGPLSQADIDALVTIIPGTNPATQDTGFYTLLAPLPGVGNCKDINGKQVCTIQTNQPGALQNYLSIIFALLIGIAGLLAVIMIVVGGIEYMSTDAFSGKEEGRERVTQAIVGLLLALGAWLILYTINPDILSLRFGLGSVSITTEESGSEHDSTSAGSSGGAITNPLCSDLSALAAQNHVPYPKKNSVELGKLIACVTLTVPENQSTIFTSDNSHDVCNYTRGDDTSSDRCSNVCSHTQNSCHYGGHNGTDGAMAADMHNANMQKLKDTALTCGAKSARCENNSGVTVDCSAATHVHMNSKDCDAN